MSIADSFKVFGAKQALKYVDRDFEHNAVKMCDWLIEHDKWYETYWLIRIITGTSWSKASIRKLMTGSGAS